MMGGVDRSDQMMNSYPVECKRLKKWYKKMWIHKKKGGKLTSAHCAAPCFEIYHKVKVL